MEDIGAMLEPDAMPIRAIQDRNALAAQSMPFYTHKGNINTKYKEVRRFTLPIIRG